MRPRPPPSSFYKPSLASPVGKQFALTSGKSKSAPLAIRVGQTSECGGREVASRCRRLLPPLICATSISRAPLAIRASRVAACLRMANGRERRRRCGDANRRLLSLTTLGLFVGYETTAKRVFGANRARLRASFLRLLKRCSESRHK